MEVDENVSSESMSPHVTTLMDDSRMSEWQAAIVALKNAVIGSNREKHKVIRQGLIPRLLSWIDEEACPVELKTEAVIVLCSLAKGGHNCVDSLVQAKAVPILLRSTNAHSTLSYTEAVLRCLRSIFMENTEDVDYLYEENSCHLSYISSFISVVNQSNVCNECVANILVCGCKTKAHQMCLLNADVIQILTPLLTSNLYKVQLPTLKFFAKFCYKNKEVSSAIVKDGKLVDTFVDLMARDKPSEMQVAAAEVLTNLHRCGMMAENSFIISRNTLGTLVRMCQNDRTIQEKVRGADILAYLIEIDPELQVIASYSFHLIQALSWCLRYKNPDSDAKDEKSVFSSLSTDQKEKIDWASEMRRAAFKAFASISANDEEIREKVIKQEGLVELLQTSLCSNNEKEVAASLRCLQSLTRSVQQIRTVLNDNSVWKPLLEKIRSGNREIMVLAMACLCNLVLEFSPSKEALIENHAVEVLCGLCRSEDNIVRLNATWGMMSMSYCASEELRLTIIAKLGKDTIVGRIQDPVLLIREKALCLVRNLLTGKMDIDTTVKSLGNETIEAVFGILSEPGLPKNVVVQALCVLSNMADGPSCKAYMIGKTDEIMAVLKYLQCPDTDYQVPVIQFVSNLVDTSDDDFGSFPGAGSYQRMLQLKNLGVQALLEGLIGTGMEDVEMRAEMALKFFA